MRLRSNISAHLSTCVLMVALCLMGSIATAHAWTSAGPWGGVIHALENAPAGGDTLYAGTGNGLYSYNMVAGGAWSLFDGTEGYRVLHILPDVDRGLLYVIARPSLDPFDFGETMWSGMLYEVSLSTRSVTPIFGVDDPATSGTDETLPVSSMALCGGGDLLATTFDEVYLDRLPNGTIVGTYPDSGMVYRRLLGENQFSGPVMPPLNPVLLSIQYALGGLGSDTVYLSRSDPTGNYSDIITSGNCGANWQVDETLTGVFSVTGGQRASAIAYDPSGLILLGTDDGQVLRRSITGTWTAYGTGLPTVHPVVDLQTDSQARLVAILRNHNYKGTLADDPSTGAWHLEGGVWRSSDQYNVVSSRVRKVLPVAGDEWLAYDQAGIWRYPSGPSSAVEVDEGVAAADLDGIVIHPRSEDRAVAFGKSGVFERRDGIWSRVVMAYIGSVLDNDYLFDAMQLIRDDRYISADFSHEDDTIWIGSEQSGLLKGTPDPLSGYRFDQVYWSYTGSNETITDIMVDPFDSNTIWFTNWSRGGVLRSEDSGVTFTSMTAHLGSNSDYSANVLRSNLMEPDQRSVLVGVNTGQTSVSGILSLDGSGQFEEADLYMNQPVGGVAFNPIDLGSKRAVAGPKSCNDGMAISGTNGTWVLDSSVSTPMGLPLSPIFKALEIPLGVDGDNLTDAFTVAQSNGSNPTPGLFHSYAGTYQGSPGEQWQEMNGVIDLFGPTSVKVHPKDGSLLWVTTRTGSAFTLRGNYYDDTAPPSFPLAGALEIVNAADVMAGVADSMELSWMAPGDDGDMPGWADRYVLYFRTDRAFVNTADLTDVGVVTVSGMPAPHISHRVEKYSLDISSYSDTRFFLAMVAYDEQDQVSALLTAATNPQAGGTDDPPPPTQGGGGGGGGCFIATAAYGSPMEPEVDLLRAYRDGYLVHRGWGRALLKAYYTLSPLPADFISSRPLLRNGARLMLSPIIATVKAVGMNGGLPVVVGFAVVTAPFTGGMMLLVFVIGKRSRESVVIASARRLVLRSLLSTEALAKVDGEGGSWLRGVSEGGSRFHAKRSRSLLRSDRRFEENMDVGSQEKAHKTINRD